MKLEQIFENEKYSWDLPEEEQSMDKAPLYC